MYKLDPKLTGNMTRQLIVSLVLMSQLAVAYNLSNKKGQQIEPKEKTFITIDSIIFQSENLIIQRLSGYVYQHTSFLNTESFGRVACNGMIVVNGNEAIIFDTPADNQSSLELINQVSKQLNCKINAVVATHFHDDCVAGLEVFHEHNIPSYANKKTVEFLKAKDNKVKIPKNSFDNKLTLHVGDKSVHTEYFGEGHTKDNVIGYFPEDDAIFGGCLIKEIGAGKGYLGDANVQAWPETVRKIKEKYPEVKIVIPGHGKPGGTALFDYTIDLFK